MTTYSIKCSDKDCVDLYLHSPLCLYDFHVYDVQVTMHRDKFL